MGKIRKPDEVATIDACLVVLTPEDGSAEPIGITSDTEVATEVQIETTDANKLMIKGVLKAQKAEQKTITGVKITLTDNMTVLEVAQAVQGGIILRDEKGKIIKYTPPISGNKEKDRAKYTLDIYTACMDSAGDIVGYEKTTYLHCVGEPVAYNSKDDEWRSAEYILNSMPKKNEPPYAIEYVDELPEVAEQAEVTPVLGELTVASIAGSVAGKTKVTVEPPLAGGNSYKYRVEASPSIPAYDQICNTGYNDWDGTSEIEGATGQKILVVEASAEGKARAAGTANVTAKE